LAPGRTSLKQGEVKEVSVYGPERVGMNGKIDVQRIERRNEIKE
jgi:hypothetical protein